MVIRLKHAIVTGYENDVGNRTDIRHVFQDPLPWVAEEDAARGARYLLSTERGFAWYTGARAAGIENAPFDFSAFPPRSVLLDGPRFDAHARSLTDSRVPPNRVLSTGLRTLLHSLAWCARVDVYGFSFFRTSREEADAAARSRAARERARFYPSVPYHYWWIQRPPNEAPAVSRGVGTGVGVGKGAGSGVDGGGGDVHDFAAEMEVIRSLSESQRIAVRPGNIDRPERIVSRPTKLDSLMAYCESARKELEILPLPDACLHHCLQKMSDPFCALPFREHPRVLDAAMAAIREKRLPTTPQDKVLFQKRVIAQ